MDYRVVRETARALALAVTCQSPTATEAALEFTRSLGDDPRALRVRVALLEGDPVAIRKAIDLVVAVTEELQVADSAPKGTLGGAS